jgi:hypothetical protein
VGDIETLRRWAHELSQGGATVTIDVGPARYTIPHACVRLEIASNIEECEPVNGVRQYRQLPGYRVTFSGDTRLQGGDDIVTREVLDG